MSEALATVMQPRMDAPADSTTSGFEGSLAPLSMCSPVYQASTPPRPVLPVLDILAAGIPIGLPFFKLTIVPKHKKWDFSPNSALNDQNGKRALAETMKANTSSEHILSFAQPEPDNGAQPGTSCSSDHPGPKLINLLSSPAKGVTNSNDGVAVEAFGSTRDIPGRDSVKTKLTRLSRSPTQTVSHR